MRSEIIEKLKQPFCPALLTDDEWEVAKSLGVQFSDPDGDNPGTWKTRKTNIGRGYTATYRLDPAYTETPEYVDYELSINELGWLCYEIAGTRYGLDEIPQTKLGGYIFEDGTIRLDRPHKWIHKTEKMQYTEIFIDDFADFDRILAKKVRVYR